MWAEAIASWIRHDALREPLTSINFALEFLIGVAVDLLLVRFGPALGLLCSILIVGPLTVVFSLLTFGDRVLFVNFMPSFIGVYLHYQVEVHREIRDLKRQLRWRERPSAPDTGLPSGSTLPPAASLPPGMANDVGENGLRASDADSSSGTPV
jgi:hypothetical protein